MQITIMTAKYSLMESISPILLLYVTRKISCQRY